MVAPHTTPPTPPPNDPATAPQRPDLHLISNAEIPPELDTEITGPIPILDANGHPVVAQAPWDIRLLTAIRAFFNSRPRFSERPASFAESWEYSTSGDWTEQDKGAKRMVHSLCTILAFLVTYPLEWLLRARVKPIGFVIAIALVTVICHLI